MPEALSDNPEWLAVLAAGVAAQRAVPGCVAVGGSAAAIYARHRFSNDTDHLLPDLRDRFGEVLAGLEQDPRWRTARVQPPVLILGKLDGVEVGFRQARRRGRIETAILNTPGGTLVVPSLDEMIGMKAYMAYSRAAVRDFLDFAALADLAGDESTIASLLRSDERYGHLQSSSVAAEIAKSLADPRPFDSDKIDLNNYKGLVPRWRDWSAVVTVSRRAGLALASRLIP